MKHRAQLADASRSPVWRMSWPLLLLLFCYALREVGGDIAVQVLSNSTSLLGGSTVLHCSLASKENITVTQMTWRKRNSDGSYTLVAVFDPKNGLNIAEPDRVKFLAAEQGKDLRNASLAISNVSVEDEGTYECQITTFPRGSRSANVGLKVLETPDNVQQNTSLGTGYIIIAIIAIIAIISAITIGVFIWKRRHGCPLRSRPRPVENNNIKYSTVNGVSIQNMEPNRTMELEDIPGTLLINEEASRETGCPV